MVNPISPTRKLYLFPPRAMKSFVNIPQLLVGDVGVNLRGGNGGMAQHGLD